MKSMGLLIGIAVIIGMVLFLKSLLSSGESSSYPYRKKEHLLNAEERRFMDKLKGAAPLFQVFPRIGLETIIGVKPGQEKSVSYLNKINRKTVDFVLFNEETVPILVVTREGASQNNGSDFIKKALDAAGVPLLTCGKREYKQEELSALITEALNKNASSEQQKK
jgi:hypothetical protein